jgi:hypothetical protein
MNHEPICPVCGESVADYKGPCPKPYDFEGEAHRIAVIAATFIRDVSAPQIASVLRAAYDAGKLAGARPYMTTAVGVASEIEALREAYDRLILKLAEAREALK